MSTQLFDEVVGELPPSTVDVVGLVRREKRRGAVRRATTLATAVVALSVTAGWGLTMAGGTGASSPPSAAGGSSAATDTRFKLVADNAESAAATAKRLSKALDDAFKKEAPGAQWIFEPDVLGETGPDGQPPQLVYKVRPGAPNKTGEMFFGQSGVLNDGRRGGLHLNVTFSYRPVDYPAGKAFPDPLTCSSEEGDCTKGTAPNGAKTVLWMLTYPWSGSDVPQVQYIGKVGLPDGLILRITHYNEFGPDGAPPAQRETPLTSQQMMAIAIDVASQIKS